MKKRLLILAVMLALGGCASGSQAPAPTAAPQSEEPVIASTEEPTVEPTPAPALKPADGLAYLNGKWTLATNDAETNGSITVEFNAAEKTVHVETRDGTFVNCTLEPHSSYDGDPSTTNDSFLFAGKDASESLMSTYKHPSNFSSYMQWFSGTFRDKDYLFLRELGNGASVLDSEVLKFENIMHDYGWVFTREHAGEAYAEPEKPEAGTYHAFCWMRDGDKVLLQRMEAFDTGEDWYGEVLNTMRIRYVQGDEYDRMMLINTEEVPGEVHPGLVQVTVDENGAMTDIHGFMYMGYGAYEHDQ